MAKTQLVRLGCIAFGFALLACHDTTRPSTPASFLYSDEFYGFDHALCDPPTDPACQPQNLTASQRVQVNNAIASLTCPNLQEYLFDSAMEGNIQAYNTDDGNWGDSHWPSNPQIHIWSGTFSSMLRQTLAHEAAHIVYHTVDEAVANQAEVDCGATS